MLFVDKLKFCFDLNNNLIIIALLNISSCLKKRLKINIESNRFDAENLVCIIDNRDKRKLYVRKRIKDFLDEICSFGVCISVDNLEYIDYILAKEYYELNEFITEVFYFANLSPESNLSLFIKAKEKFIDKFGDTILA